MKLKLFTSYFDGQIQCLVNEWIAEQEPMIQIETTHFSTSTETEIDDGVVKYLTKYSVAIFYHEL